jgi:hypothetical protein
MSQVNNTFIIPVETIKKFKELYDNKIVEFCCFIDVDYSTNSLNYIPKCWEGEIVEYKSIDGTTKNRGSCVYYTKDNKYPPFIFHTHPKQDYPWPSREDIFKLIKHHDINASIIYTNAGIWILRLPQATKNMITKNFLINDKIDIQKYNYYYGKYFDYLNQTLLEHYKANNYLDFNFTYNVINIFNSKVFSTIKFIPHQLIQQNIDKPILFTIN